MKKKKLIRTIVIAAVVALIVICAIVFSILLRKDSRGLNYFDRNKVIATAGGQRVTMGEYVMSLDNSLSYYSQVYSSSTFSEDDLKSIKTNVINSLLSQKVFLQKLKELGISLTAEELAKCKTDAQEQLNSLEESIGKQMVSSSGFSKASLETQINDYFTRQLGMTKAQYKQFIEAQAQATLAEEKIQEYYASDVQNYTDADLIAYYDETVTENYADSYFAGQYSMSMQMYSLGYAQQPFLYIPEHFVYVDVIELDAESEEEVQQFYARLENGETFEELAADEKNVSALKNSALPAPYAIGPDDSSYVSDYVDLYVTASQLEVGATTCITDPTTKTNEDGTETTTCKGYVIRRSEGKLCEGGAQTGIVDIDAYPGIRDSFKESYEAKRFNDIASVWMEDKVIDDAAYNYSSPYVTVS